MADGQIMVIDEQKMLDKILSFPAQLEAAWTNLWTQDLPVKPEGFNKVIIAGMGGSGIAGQLAAELLLDQSPVPIFTWADYGLPHWADDKTLLIAVSCSGDTEETLDGVRQAVERKMPVIGLASGGKLVELGEIHGFPVIKINYDGLPRAGLGWLYGSVLTVLVKLKLTQIDEPKYFQALKELQKSISHKQFPSKAEELAVTLNNKVPVIMAYPPLSAVALRYAGELNENSKTSAFALRLPEACHNFISGLDFAVPEKLMILLLESKFGFSRNVARQKILTTLFKNKDITAVPLSVQAGSPLAEQWLLIHFGDLVSFYLAGVVGVDPSPIEAVQFLKAELAKL